MRRMRIPNRVLAAEVRAGHLSVDARGVATATGVLGGVVGGLAASGLKKAAQSDTTGAPLKFPRACCNCMATGRVRALESASVVNRGADYTFRFMVPHCSRCAGTASRKRPGVLGLAAAFLAISVPVFILMLGFGAAINLDALITAGFIVAPLLGLGLPYAWTVLRRAAPGQSSRYQAVYAAALSAGLSGEPTDFTLAFENDAYALQFLRLNADAGVIEIRPGEEGSPQLDIGRAAADAQKRTGGRVRR